MVPTVVLPPVMLFTLQVTGVALPAAVSCWFPFSATVNALGVTETGAAGVGEGMGVGTGVGVGVGVPLPPPPQATRPNRIRHSRHEAKILLISRSPLHKAKNQNRDNSIGRMWLLYWIPRVVPLVTQSSWPEVIFACSSRKFRVQASIFTWSGLVLSATRKSNFSANRFHSGRVI